jgi:hypothetical protein
MAVLELVIPKKLESPNATRGYHWRRRHRDTLRWEALVCLVGVHTPTFSQWNLITGARSRLWRGRVQVLTVRRRERRRVTIIRQVASRRHFIRDDDNLQFSAKPLNDALKRLGLVYDDTRTWMVQPLPTQQVSPNGVAWTIVRIEPIDANTSETVPETQCPSGTSC